MSFIALCTSLLIGTPIGFAQMSNASSIAKERIAALVPASAPAIMFFGRTSSGRSCDGMIEASEKGVHLGITSGTMLGLALDNFSLESLRISNVKESNNSITIQAVDPRDGKRVQAIVFVDERNGQKTPVGLEFYEEQDSWFGFGKPKLKLVSSCL